MKELLKKEYTKELYKKLRDEAEKTEKIIFEEEDKYILIDKPIADIKKLKGYKYEEINEIRDSKKLTEGADYNGDIFDVDDISQNNIIGKIVSSSLLPEETVFLYRSKTNKNHSFTKEELAGLGIAIGNKVEEIYKKSWELKEEVSKAINEKDLEKIIW